MKILMINETFAFAGGAEQYLADICFGFLEGGHKVGVVYGEKAVSARRRAPGGDLGLKIFYVENLGVEGVLEAVAKFNPDVVNLQNVFDPGLYRALAKVKPTVRFIHDHKTYCPGTAKLWFSSNKICPLTTSWRCAFYAYKEKCLSRRPVRMLRRIKNARAVIKALDGLDRVVCNSDYVKTQLLLGGLTEGKIVVNPLFPGGRRGKCHSITLEYRTEVPEILFVGRIFREKGVDYLLLACARIASPYALKVVGEGWDMARLRDLSADLGIRGKVEFLGWQPPAKLDEYYQRCRLLVLPSIWPEPFGMTGLEALSFAKPVVAFKVGGIVDWLKNGAVGFLVERGNIEELALRIGQLLTDKEQAAKMGRAGRAWVGERFSLGRHRGRLMEVYREVIERRRCGDGGFDRN